MKIRKIEMTRLSALSETPNENGLYDLIPFVDNLSDFNQEFERDCLDATLDALVSRLYEGGKGIYLEVDETDLAASGIEVRGEFLRVQVGEEIIEVPNILDEINADSDKSAIYLLVNPALTEGCWVISEELMP